MNRSACLTRRLAGLASLASALATTLPLPAGAQALFGARELPQERFVLVAAPIGDGTRAQLNIYEQITDRRPCFATSGANPARVDPLLGSFDFTGICSRYLDANGYSLRIGGEDLATVYRISVVRSGNDNLLLAAPTRNQPGPEMVVARTQGHDAGFLLFMPEPGWKLMRRHFGNRALGHLYIYRETWPGAENSTGTGAGSTQVKPVAPAQPPLPGSKELPSSGSPVQSGKQPLPEAVPSSKLPEQPVLTPRPLPAPGTVAPAAGGTVPKTP